MRLEQFVRPAPYAISQVIGEEIKPLITFGAQLIEVATTPTSGVTLDQVDERIGLNNFQYTQTRW